MKTLNRSQLLAVVLILLLFGGLLLAQMLQEPLLYSFDPWIQRFFTDFGESDQLFNRAVTIHSGQFVIPNGSFLRTTAYLLTEGSALDSFVLFQVAPVLLRLIYVLLLMMIVIAMTHKVQYALVMGIVIFSSPYFVFRSHVLIPQNIAVLFFLLMIWGFEKYRKTGRMLFLIVVIVSVLGSVFYDPTSIIVSGIIILSYAVVYLINEDVRKVEFTFFSLLICVVILIPWFGTLIEVAQATFGSFGDNSVWAQYTGGQDSTLPPLINTYLELVGYPVMIFAFLGIVAILWRNIRRYIHLLIMLGSMLLLTVNLSPQIVLSPGRMQDYLYIPLVLIAAVYVSMLFPRTGRLFRMALISLMITFGIATMINHPPWSRLEPGAIEVAETVDNLLEANPSAIVYVETDAMITAVLLRHPEQICAYWDPVFSWYQPPANGDVPDCTIADYRLTRSNRSLQQYQIIQQIDNYSVYERLPEQS